jgi:hypothetical protein
MLNFPQTTIGKFVGAFWYLACASDLLYGFIVSLTRNQPTTFFAIMILLSAPTSIPATILLWMFLVLFSQSSGLGGHSFILMLIAWAVFFLIGYWQWFIALPRVIRRFRERAASNLAIQGGRGAPRR